MNDDVVELIEFEAMLFNRYSLVSHRTRPTGLDRSVYTLLARIAAQAPMSIGQLSDALGLETSTVNRQTAAAVRGGQLRRIQDPDGGPARKFELTDRGRAHLERERLHRVDYLHRFLAEWSADDLAMLATCLQRLNSDIERHQGAGWPRPGQLTIARR